MALGCCRCPSWLCHMLLLLRRDIICWSRRAVSTCWWHIVLPGIMVFLMLLAGVARPKPYDKGKTDEREFSKASNFEERAKLKGQFPFVIAYAPATERTEAIIANMKSRLGECLERAYAYEFVGYQTENEMLEAHKQMYSALTTNSSNATATPTTTTTTTAATTATPSKPFNIAFVLRITPPSGGSEFSRARKRHTRRSGDNDDYDDDDDEEKVEVVIRPSPHSNLWFNGDQVPRFSKACSKNSLPGYQEEGVTLLLHLITEAVVTEANPAAPGINVITSELPCLDLGHIRAFMSFVITVAFLPSTAALTYNLRRRLWKRTGIIFRLYSVRYVTLVIYEIIWILGHLVVVSSLFQVVFLTTEFPTVIKLRRHDLLFMMFFCYGLAANSMGFMAAVLAGVHVKPMDVTNVVILLTAAQAVPAAFSAFSRKMSRRLVLSSIFFGAALDLAVELLLLEERNDKGVPESEFAVPSHNGITVFTVSSMFLLQTLVHCLLPLGILALWQSWVFCRTRPMQRPVTCGKSMLFCGGQYDDDSMPLQGVYPRVEFREVSKTASQSFNQEDAWQAALHSVSFEIQPGETVAVLGKQAAGKSALVHILTGQTRADAGLVLIDGRNPRDYLRRHPFKVGLCPQHIFLHGLLTVEETLYFYCKLCKCKSAKEHVKQLLYTFKLDSVSFIGCGHLSMAGVRRLQLAIACLSDPMLLVLDEPTSLMDERSENAMENILEKLPMTTLFCTASGKAALRVADRIVLMSNGTVVFVGTASQLKESMGAGYLLTISLKQGCNVDSLTTYIRLFVPRLYVLSKGHTTLTCVLPDTATSKFEFFLANLDWKRKKLKVYDFGVSYVSLDDLLYWLPSVQFLRARLKQIQARKDAMEDFSLERLLMQCHAKAEPVLIYSAITRSRSLGDLSSLKEELQKLYLNNSNSCPVDGARLLCDCCAAAIQDFDENIQRVSRGGAIWCERYADACFDGAIGETGCCCLCRDRRMEDVMRRSSRAPDTFWCGGDEVCGNNAITRARTVSSSGHVRDFIGEDGALVCVNNIGIAWSGSCFGATVFRIDAVFLHPVALGSVSESKSMPEGAISTSNSEWSEESKQSDSDCFRGGSNLLPSTLCYPTRKIVFLFSCKPHLEVCDHMVFMHTDSFKISCLPQGAPYHTRISHLPRPLIVVNRAGMTSLHLVAEPPGTEYLFQTFENLYRRGSRLGLSTRETAKKRLINGDESILCAIVLSDLEHNPLKVCFIKHEVYARKTAKRLMDGDEGILCAIILPDSQHKFLEVCSINHQVYARERMFSATLHKPKRHHHKQCACVLSGVDTARRMLQRRLQTRAAVSQRVRVVSPPAAMDTNQSANPGASVSPDPTSSNRPTGAELMSTVGVLNTVPTTGGEPAKRSSFAKKFGPPGRKGSMGKWSFLALVTTGLKAFPKPETSAVASEAMDESRMSTKSRATSNPTDLFTRKKEAWPPTLSELALADLGNFHYMPSSEASLEASERRFTSWYAPSPSWMNLQCQRLFTLQGKEFAYFLRSLPWTLLYLVLPVIIVAYSQCLWAQPQRATDEPLSLNTCSFAPYQVFVEATYLDPDNAGHLKDFYRKLVSCKKPGHRVLDARSPDRLSFMGVELFTVEYPLEPSCQRQLTAMVYYDSSAYHSKPLAMAAAMQAYFQCYADPGVAHCDIGHDAKSSISFTVHMLPLYPDIERVAGVANMSAMTEDESLACTMTSMVLVVALGWLTATFASTLVQERVLGFQFVQQLTGTAAVLQLVCLLALHLVIFISSTAITLLPLALEQSPIFFEWKLLVVSLLMYGLATLPLVYTLSEYFKKPAVAVGTIWVLLSAIGYTPFWKWDGHHHSNTTLGWKGLDELVLPEKEMIYLLSRLPTPSASLAALTYSLCVLGRRCAGGCPNAYGHWFLAHFVHLGVQTLAWLCLWACIQRKISFYKKPSRWWSKHGLKKCCEKKMQPSSLVISPSQIKRSKKRKKREPGSDDNSPTESKEMIVVKNAFKFDPKLHHKILRGVSLRVTQGTCMGVLGGRGAGKTTLLEMVVGLVAPDSGLVSVVPDTVTSPAGDQAKSGVTYCPAKHGVMPLLTARETLMMVGRLRGATWAELRRDIAFHLEILGLTDRADSLCATYSEAELTKTRLCLALIARPSVVILDEPTTGLSQIDTQALGYLLGRHRRGGGTVLLATGMPELCEAVCTDVATLRHGILSKVKAVTSGHDPALEGSRFCLGYLVNLLFRKGGKSGSARPAEEFFTEVSEKIPDIEIFSDEQGSATFHLKRRDVNLAKVFQLMEDGKLVWGLREYTVGRVGLGYVLANAFASMQDVRANQADARRNRTAFLRGMDASSASSHMTISTSIV